jgi:hypothetical protein
MRYQVERHSGRGSGAFRQLLDTDDGERARKLYEAHSVALRQGAVRLVIAGTIANTTIAPRLRTRW